MVQRTVRVAVRTTAGNAKEDVEKAVDQALRVQYKEMMGPLGPPVAAKVGEIMGQKAEEVCRGWLTGRNCFLLASSDLEGTDVEVAYNKLLDAPGKGYIGYIITWTGDFNPGLIRDRILDYYEQKGIKPESIRKCNRIGIMVHGHAAGAAVAKRLLGGPVYADEIFDAVEPFIEPGGELWLFICRGEQYLWDEAISASKRDFKVVVWPGENRDCIFERDIEPYIGPMLGP
ncbi:MAG: hypothetical protein PVH29_11730 [Candidatus Zixiibacteriota bacterium]|jgi:hypothetical protein